MGSVRVSRWMAYLSTAYAVRVMPMAGTEEESREVLPTPTAASPPDAPYVYGVHWADTRTLIVKGYDRTGRTGIWSVPMDGGAPRRLVRFDDPQRQSPRPEFAFDGQRLYFTIVERESDLYTMTITRR